MDLVVRNITVVNPDRVLENVDIGIEDGRIVRMGRLGLLEEPHQVSGEGLHAFPAFADMHCHLRLNGYTRKDDLLPGARAAAAGGFSDICLMPDTSPPVDSAALAEDVMRHCEHAPCRVHPISCVTRGMRGERVVRMDKIAAAGAVAFSDNGRPIESMEVLLDAATEAFEGGHTIMIREEAADSRIGTSARDERREERKGDAGVGPESERSMLSRDLYVAETRGPRMHFCDMATAADLALVRASKLKRTAGVSCSTSPMFYALPDSAMLGHNRQLDLNSSPAGLDSKKAVVKALMDGTIDCLTTDPRMDSGDTGRNERGPAGPLGFAYAFPIAMTYLHKPGLLGLTRVCALMSSNPRRLLGIPGGRIAVDQPADIAICDVDGVFTSKSEEGNAPAGGLVRSGTRLHGRVEMTIRGGQVVYDRSAR